MITFIDENLKKGKKIDAKYQFKFKLFSSFNFLKD